VFSLGQQIGGDPTWIALYGQDNCFRRPRGQIDRAVAAYELLGGGDVFVAGPEEFFDAWNRFRAVSQSCDGLRAADAGDFPDAKHICGHEKFAIRLWADSHNAVHTGDLGGDGGHEERRNEGEAAAW
jgi:hypothetical protein